MTQDIKDVLKLALEALEKLEKHNRGVKLTTVKTGVVAYPAQIAQEAITAIKEALAQPDQYAKGYADAMNWKVQNHLEHLPTAQPEQEPVADALHFAQWDAAKKDLSEYIHVGSLTLAGIEDNLDGTEFGESEIERFEAVIEALQEKLINGRECKKVPLIAYIGGHNRHTTPPQRTWVGLTDDEIIDVLHPLVMADMSDEATDYEIARAIEAKLKEKNGYAEENKHD